MYSLSLWALCQWGYKFKAESSGKFKHILLGLYLHVTSAVTCLGVFRGRDVLMCGQIFAPIYSHCGTNSGDRGVL